MSDDIDYGTIWCSICDNPYPADAFSGPDTFLICWRCLPAIVGAPAPGNRAQRRAKAKR